MNERFREIIAEAGLVYWPNKELDRVAELLVRECMDLVKDCYAEAKSGESQYKTVCASTIIEDHFGVKE